MIEISGKGNIEENLKAALKRVKNLQRPFKLMGLQMLKSTDKTFKDQGRPKWDDLKKATKKRRRKGKKKELGIKILIDTGLLRRSQVFEASKKNLKWGPSKIGFYGIAHQKYSPNTKEPLPKIPRRAFLGFYPEDEKRLEQILAQEMDRIMGVR